RHNGESFSLGIEVKLPDPVREAVVKLSPPAVQKDASKHATHIRYELRLRVNEHQMAVQNEYLFLFTHSEEYEEQRLPLQGENASKGDWQFIIERAYGGDTTFRPEGKGAKRAAAIDDTLPALLRIQVENKKEFPAAT